MEESWTTGRGVRQDGSDEQDCSQVEVPAGEVQVHRPREFPCITPPLQLIDTTIKWDYNGNTLSAKVAGISDRRRKVRILSASLLNSDEEFNQTISRL